MSGVRASGSAGERDRAARHGVTTLQPMPTLSEAVTDAFQPLRFPLPGRRDVSATWARGASYPLVAGQLSGECDGGALRQTRLPAAFPSRNAFSPASGAGRGGPPASRVFCFLRKAEHDPGKSLADPP